MPLVTIETRRWMSAEQKREAFTAIHAALAAAFRIPANDRAQRIVEYAADDFEIPPGKGDRFTVVQIDGFSGRSIEAKRTLYREIVARLESVGIPPSDLLIVLREAPPENWGIRGGHAACDIDLGFSLKV